MTKSVLIFLYKAGEHCAPVDNAYSPEVILYAEANNLLYGDNGLFISNNTNVRVREIQLIGNAKVDVDSFNYDFCYFSRAQRQVSNVSTDKLQSILTNIKPDETPSALALVPMVVAIIGLEHLEFYHYVQQGEPGALFLHYHSTEWKEKSNWSDLMTSLQSGQSRLNQIWPLLNDDCWFSKWRADIEMERKFTFEGIPNTWMLINRLYDEILTNGLKGFIPELDREFQVFDYESHIFDVFDNPTEAGYISFIPQADGRMTLKRKWFVENTEIRKETVIANLDIQPNQMQAKVQSMTTAATQKMPVFRRKRFDVNFESLRTGNIYGVYFDICRTSSPEHSFAQCEVEYCRSRTFQPLHDVVEEFEFVAEYTRDFLERMQIDFVHNTFSKLDFVREAQSMSVQ